MTDKELEKLFRNKLNNREFAFNPDNFAGVERLLAANKIAWYQTFAFKIATFATAAALLLGAVILNWGSNTNDTPTYNPSNTPPLAVTPAASGMEVPEYEKLYNNLQSPGNIQHFNPGDFAVNFKSFSAKSKSNRSDNSSKPTTQADAASDYHARNVALLNNPNTSQKNTPTTATDAGTELLNTVPQTDAASAISADETQTIALDEQAPAPEQIPIPLTPQHARLLQHQFYFQVGFNIAQGLVGNVSDNQEAASNFVAGATYRYLMNPFWEFQAGLSYNNRGALNNVRITEEKLYSFGAEKLETHYNIQRINYLEAPLAIRWFPQSKHTVVTGAYAAYLLSTQTEVHYLQHFTNAIEEKIQMERGHTTGINRWDFGLVLGYDYQVTPQLNLGIQTLTGFKDLFEDGAYQHVAFNNGTQVRVLLNYRFW